MTKINTQHTRRIHIMASRAQVAGRSADIHHTLTIMAIGHESTVHG